MISSGNYAGSNPYEPGEACETCRHSCEDGLCGEN